MEASLRGAVDEKYSVVSEQLWGGGARRRTGSGVKSKHFLPPF